MTPVFMRPPTHPVHRAVISGSPTTHCLDVLLVLLVIFLSVYSSRPDKVIQVAGHRDVAYQAVLSAMDAARSAGVRVISLPPSGSYLEK